MEPKIIQYLDLELPQNKKNLVIFDKYKFSCYFDTKYKHSLHSNDSSRNSIVDLIISLSESFQIHQEKMYRIIEKLTNIIIFKKQTIEDFNEKIVYIKGQNNEIIQKSNTYFEKVKNQSTKNLIILSLVSKIKDDFDKLNEIKLSLQKINITFNELKQIILT